MPSEAEGVCEGRRWQVRWYKPPVPLGRLPSEERAVRLRPAHADAPDACSDHPLAVGDEPGRR